MRRMEGYADEVQAQDGQMKSIRKKDNIGQVLAPSPLPPSHAATKANEGGLKMGKIKGGGGIGGSGSKRGPDILTRSEATAKATAVGLT